MNLKRTLVATVVALVAGSVLAEDAHHPDKAGTAAQQPAAKDAPGTADMATMQENMKRMQDQMRRIHAASDPMERQRLIDEHMKSMHESMSMMGGMPGGGKGPDAHGRMEGMEHCMDMMKTMTQQMTEQRSEPTPK